MAIANINGSYSSLLVAPNSMKNKIITLIQGEIEKAKQGNEAQIIIKINSLTDRETIDAIKDASQAGVKVYMIIRGICCLLPDIEGYYGKCIYNHRTTKTNQKYPSVNL